MTEEENKAIYNLKHIKQHWEPTEEDELGNIEYKSICIALDLIEKQQKEMEEQGLRLLELAHKLTFDYISKDKIREKIKEVSNGVYDAKLILKELIEE